MRAEPYSEFGQPDLAGAESLAGLTSLVLYWGHIPLSVPDVTKQSSCIMERLSRFFVKENCMS